jgi:hypothetical protein
MTVAFACITRVSEAESIASLSSGEPASVLPLAISSPGAEAGRGEVPGEIVTNLAQ